MILIFKIFKVIIIQLLVIITLFVAVMSFPTSRHYFLSGIFKIPEFYYLNYLKTDLIHRDFESITSKLDKYHSLVQLINIQKNRLSPGYIDLLINSYDRTVLDGEKILFKKLMEKSLSFDPDNIFILTSLIDIYSIVEPALNYELNLYEKAISINPSFRKIYISGIKQAIAQSDQIKIDFFCNKYLSAVTGEAKDYNTSYLLGKANNKIAIYLNKNNNDEQLYLNEGLIIGDNVIRFNINNFNNLKNFSIIFPNTNDLIFKLNKLGIRSDNNTVNSFTPKDLKILSSSGAIINEDFYNISNLTNKLDIFLPSDINSSINEIIVDFKLRKSFFFNEKVCKFIDNE
tara:strand:- start:484 stop:1515 length:1032 start_codon:yes stop_codon:yes gene_type:complete